MHVKLLQRAAMALVEMTVREKLAVLGTIGALLIAVTFLVHTTGGVRFVYVHFAYIPILLGAFEIART